MQIVRGMNGGGASARSPPISMLLCAAYAPIPARRSLPITEIAWPSPSRSSMNSGTGLGLGTGHECTMPAQSPARPLAASRGKVDSLMVLRPEGARPHLLDLRVFVPADFADTATSVRVGEREVMPVTAAHVLDGAAIAYPAPKHRNGEGVNVASRVSPVEAALLHRMSVRSRVTRLFVFRIGGRVPDSANSRSENVEPGAAASAFGFRALGQPNPWWPKRRRDA
jgi:hypothetical protein